MRWKYFVLSCVHPCIFCHCDLLFLDFLFTSYQVVSFDQLPCVLSAVMSQWWPWSRHMKAKSCMMSGRKPYISMSLNTCTILPLHSLGHFLLFLGDTFLMNCSREDLCFQEMGQHFATKCKAYLQLRQFCMVLTFFFVKIFAKNHENFVFQ